MVKHQAIGEGPRTQPCVSVQKHTLEPLHAGSSPVTHERLCPGLGCSLPGLAWFPRLRRFTLFLRRGLRLHRPHGAGFITTRGGECVFLYTYTVICPSGLLGPTCVRGPLLNFSIVLFICSSRNQCFGVS